MWELGLENKVRVQGIGCFGVGVWGLGFLGICGNTVGVGNIRNDAVQTKSYAPGDP